MDDTQRYAKAKEVHAEVESILAKGRISPSDRRLLALLLEKLLELLGFDLQREIDF